MANLGDEYTPAEATLTPRMVREERESQTVPPPPPPPRPYRSFTKP